MQRLPQRIRCQSDKDNKGDNYISLPSSCQMLFLTESTLRYHIIRKRLRAFKSGGRWYLRKDDVEAFKKWNSNQAKLD
jgi:excisionase family DNA binding protein